ncbi:MAG TPA: tyrosine-type recombinase/integrase [Edaphobacter sp.]|nr:tyrosine-type recombinase/integrase [Edaphobacter sp.]
MKRRQKPHGNPCPSAPSAGEELRQWRRASLYRSDEDFVFPSIAKNGGQPISPDMILKHLIRPALKQVGVTKRIGFHSFRHGLATMLRQRGVDIKTAQELLLHANRKITLEIYQQSVAEENERPRTESWGCCSLQMKKAQKDQTLQHPWRSIGKQLSKP